MTDSSGEGRALVDTNIVVYAYDPEDPTKHQVARDLLRTRSEAGRLVYSTQVFNEFCSVMMRPRRPTPLAPERIAEILGRLAATGVVVPNTPAMTFRALEAMPRHGFSFWDALIWAAAREHGIPTVYTEDFQHERDIEGVRFLNPFAITG
jgi:predicted nucleic acid-binding protein